MTYLLCHDIFFNFDSNTMSPTVTYKLSKDYAYHYMYMSQVLNTVKKRIEKTYKDICQ